MKKVALIALLAVGGFALASSLNVPWYVDNAPNNTGLSPTVPGENLCLVSLHNNTADVMVCRVDYYAQDGTFLDYDGADPASTDFDPARNLWSPTNNTFEIAPNATIQFRPNKYDLVDPTNNPLGQESEAGAAVPDRPRYGAGGTSTRKQNGSLVVTWAGAPTDVQGKAQEWGLNISSAYLLPPGA